MDYNSDDHLEEVFTLLDTIPRNMVARGVFMGNLRNMIEGGKILLNIKNADAPGRLWDGNLEVVCFNVDEKELVNEILNTSKANSFHMEDRHILTLWWD